MDGNWYLDPATGWWTLTVPAGSTLVSVLNWAGRYSGVTNAELLTQEPTGSGLTVTVLSFTDDALTLRATGAGAVQPVRVSFANSQQEVIRLAFVAPMATVPVTIDEAKAFLRVQHNDEDALIASLIGAARAWIEAATGLLLASRQRVVSYPKFGERLALIHRPLVTVDGVVYDDTAGVEQTLSSWRVRQFAGMPAIVPAANERFPATEAIDGAVRVTITGGYASVADIPSDVKQAALLLISHWYDNRTAVTLGMSGATVPYGVLELLAIHRRWIVG